MTAEQRQCPACGNQFTWTPAAPRQRFCSTRCKHRWHDARKRARRRGHPGPAAGDDARPPAATTHVAGGPTTPVAATTTHVAGAANHAAGLTATPACPHCRQPVALVAWLVPPAASITTPPRHAETIRDNQQPVL
jgi:endogenous inhibitor of DNA gyrase (YacG/DUF329 family)